MKRQITYEALKRIVSVYGHLTLVADEIGATQTITPRNMNGWELALKANAFAFKWKRYTRADFLRVLDREMLPGTVWQIG